MVTLVILDGFGINKSKKGNAIKLSGTPNLKNWILTQPQL